MQKMMKCKASSKNQCPQHWFMTQWQQQLVTKVSPPLHKLPKFLEKVCSFIVPHFDDYNIEQKSLKKSMHLEIKKLGLKTYNLENKKPMYIHGTKIIFFFFKPEFAKTMKISKKMTRYANLLMNKVQFVIGPSLG